VVLDRAKRFALCSKSRSQPICARPSRRCMCYAPLPGSYPFASPALFTRCRGGNALEDPRVAAMARRTLETVARFARARSLEATAPPWWGLAAGSRIICRSFGTGGIITARGRPVFSGIGITRESWERRCRGGRGAANRGSFRAAVWANPLPTSAPVRQRTTLTPACGLTSARGGLTATWATEPRSHGYDIHPVSDTIPSTGCDYRSPV
jgi:hypothetical protein